MMKTLTWSHALRYGPLAVAALVCALSLVAMLQFSLPATMPAALPFSESLYAHTLAATNSDTRLKLAEKTRDAAPNRAENWLLLAAARQQKDGGLSARVLEALRQSYTIAPLSPDAHDWRLDYVFSNWHMMPTDLKARAMTEAEAYLTRYAGSVYLRQLVRSLPDREGRLALNLILLTHDHAADSSRRVAEHRALQDAWNNYGRK